MTTVDAFLTGAGASIISSGIIGLAVKIYLEAAIKQRFNTQNALLQQKLLAETEKLKVNLALKQESQHEMNKRRFEAYPLLVQHVYKTRNAAREAVDGSVQVSKAMTDDFYSSIRALEDCLYGYRLDLERDHTFTCVHTFKNAAKLFGLDLGDLSYHLSRAETEKVKAIRLKMSEAYRPLDKLYFDVVERLAAMNDGSE
jgi:hypothetical protein